MDGKTKRRNPQRRQVLVRDVVRARLFCSFIFASFRSDPMRGKKQGFAFCRLSLLEVEFPVAGFLDQPYLVGRGLPVPVGDFDFDPVAWFSF
ncbi:MAG: hypothetical protein LBU11_12255 [Zoogloeaceae bacterium]|jgi:hypothetical protein|nr:hypothetical protein [Zoogloeaceae bacterium]